MGKAPAFQFFVKDWLSDPQLRMTSASTKGIWIDLLCYMWWSDSGGKLELTIDEIVKLTSAQNGEVQLFLDEAKKYKFCNVFVTRDGMSQICNRRMTRESKSRELHRIRQQKYRDKHKRDKNVTPSSPSPSPSPTPKTTTYPKEFLLFWDKYPKKKAKKEAFKAYQRAKDKPPIAELLKIIEQHIETEQWKKEGGEYIPYPATFLNKGMWEDEIKTKKETDKTLWRKEALKDQ